MSSLFNLLSNRSLRVDCPNTWKLDARIPTMYNMNNREFVMFPKVD
jgi:hypothetical protein